MHGLGLSTTSGVTLKVWLCEHTNKARLRSRDEAAGVGELSPAICLIKGQCPEPRKSPTDTARRGPRA